MSFMMHDHGHAPVPTVDQYAFQLRNGLREATRASLIELEESINLKGFGWMDGYMEQILDRGNRAPIAELMKTPSRTHGTSKKTRANTTAAKDRTEKVKGLNARLLLSPSPAKQSASSRMPLSPLQPRSLNAIQASPVLVASPKAPKADKAPAGKGKPKAKAKRGRPKKAAETNENTPPTSQIDHSAPSTQSSTSSRKPTSAVNSSQAEGGEKSKSSRSKKAKVAVVEEVATTPEELVAIEEPTTAAVDDPEPMAEDLPSRSITIHDNHVEPDSAVADQEEEVGASDSARKHKATVSATGIAPELDTIDVEHVETASPLEAQHPSSEAGDVIEVDVPEVTATAGAVESPKAVTAAPPVPVRQVRSSWLSKALGTGTVPISGMPANDPSALRKSYAPPAQQRQSVALDFAGLRKSLAPIGGLKRKSDEGVEVESDEEESRPEKITKFSTALLPAKPEATTAQPMPTRTPGPITRPTLPAKTPSFGVASVAPDSQSRSNPPSATQGDNHRSDIHKVTKALDELRERAAAKEVAKQKAALAASTGPPRVPQAKSTGTGFLRGLGSLGAGLLGMGGNTAEEEAERLARELEAERMAELELEKLLRDAVKADKEYKDEEANAADATEAQMDDKDDVAHPIKAGTPEVVSRGDAKPSSPQEEEEMVEEQSVIDELVPEETARQMIGEPESTTPTGTPTRPQAVQVEAPPLHDRVEKHQHHDDPINQKQVKDREPEQAQEVIELNNAPDLMEEEMELDELDDDEEDIEEIERPQRAQSARPEQPSRYETTKTHRKMPSASSSATLLGMSIASTTTTASGLGQAQAMAAKALGIKPATGPVKSLAAAAAAARKEQATADRKAQMKDQVDQRKAELIRRKAEEDRVKADLERKAKVAELEEKRRQRAEHEKRKKERDEKMAAIAKEKAAKEEREAQAARAKAAEEEAARKRKLAASLNKSQNGPAAKRIANPATQSTGPGASANKGKEPFRPSKQGTASGLASSTSTQQGQKMGPTSFRTAPPEAHQQSQSSSSTITLVSQQSLAQTQTAERKVLGPPSRPSAMAHGAQPLALRQSTAVQNGLHGHGPAHGHGQASASSVLQQQRVALQSQLDEKATMVQSEDIVLPDIASEYSDSDDEDRSRDFIRPQWAESPELRAALEAQAHRDPDELFGPIKPLNMEELFKVHKGKFRARTSSANWGRGDGLSKAEEVEYARRMGFKGSNLAGRDSGL